MKARSHSGAKKRFRVTRNGKVMHSKMNKNHILEKKSPKRKRRLSEDGQLTGGDAKRVIRMLTGR